MGEPSFADQLRHYRRRRHLTQEELAERAGLSPAAISLLERGRTQAPQRFTMWALSHALGLSSDEAAALTQAARGFAPPDGAADDESDTGIGTGTDVSASSVHAGHLPVPLTDLIGRTDDVQTLRELLGQSSTRLVTLTGPAGVGKTRLALHLAASVRDDEGQDVVFVDLIPVQEPEHVLATIAQSLGVQKSVPLPLREAVVRHLRDRRVLLVLDNFEHVLQAARGVLELLVACPQVKALVTSRAALNVRGEICYPVAPLALPHANDWLSVAGMRAVPTVALFLERAHAAWPGANIATLDDVRMVAGICAALDGLPLAIELAAARVRDLGLRQLRDRLAEPVFLGILADGPQDLADHQRTMRSTVAWSYNLLAPDDQRLFRALAVFVGGASLEALAHVSAMSDEAVLRGLFALVNVNLTQCVESAGLRRYTQLATLRAYAQEQLRSAGEWDEVRRRHAEYWLTMTQALDMHAVNQPEAVMLQLETDYPNIRAALAWAWETGATRQGLAMVSRLRRFWMSDFREGLDWLERFIGRAEELASAADLDLLAQAWTSVMVITHRMDRFEQARAAGEQALALRRQLGDTHDIAGALMNLANPLTRLREFERAHRLLEECLALTGELGDRRAMVLPLLNLGGLHYDIGEPLKALAYYEDSLALSRDTGESEWARALTWNSVGEAYIALDHASRAIEVTVGAHTLFEQHHDTFGAAMSAFTLGRAEWRLGQVAQARAHLDEAERLFTTLGSSHAIVRIRYVRASVALQQGDAMAAASELARALAEVGTQAHTSECLWWLAERAGTLARHIGEMETAAHLLGAAIAQRTKQPEHLEPAERDLRACDLQALAAAVGEPAAARWLRKGEDLSADDVLVLLRRAVGVPESMP